MSGTESFTIGMHHQKSPVQTQPSIPSMRLAYAPDGTTIYKPVTPTPAPPPHPISSSTPTTAPSPSSSPLFQPSPTVGGAHGAATTPNTDPSQPAPAHGPAFNANTASGAEPLKKKRGRPRKYGPDGSMALSLVPVGAASAGGPTPPGFTSSSSGAPGTGDAVKKAKGGRPPGSSNKKVQMAALVKGCTFFQRKFPQQNAPLMLQILTESEKGIEEEGVRLEKANEEETRVEGRYPGRIASGVNVVSYQAQIVKHSPRLIRMCGPEQQGFNPEDKEQGQATQKETQTTTRETREVS